MLQTCTPAQRCNAMTESGMLAGRCDGIIRDLKCHQSEGLASRKQCCLLLDALKTETELRRPACCSP
jgi:hypothetical protein